MAQNKIRIILLTDCLADLRGGAERQIYELASRLDKTKYNPVIASLECEGQAPRDVIEAAGCRLETFPVKRIYGLSGLIQGFKFFRFLKSQGTILITYHFSSDIWGPFWARLAGVKAIISNRRDLGFWRKKHHVLAYRFINRWVKRIVVVADAVKEMVIRGEGYPAERIEVIHNGVELEPVTSCQSVRSEAEPPRRGPGSAQASPKGTSHQVIKTGDPVTRPRRPLGVGVPAEPSGCPGDQVSSIRSEIGLNDNDVGIMCVGQMWAVKGHRYLLEAVEQIASQCESLPEGDQSVKLVLIGEGVLREYLRRSAERLGILDHVIFLGERSDARRLLAAADICVLPSLSEGLSNAILEYMAAGKPVVATRVGGNSELIQDGVEGLLVEKADVGQLASALLRLIENPQERRMMGEKGQAKVKGQFTMEAMINHYEKVFKELTRDFLSTGSSS